MIVTSVDEAREAEAGGADRLELVRALERGGFTPELGLAREVIEAVSIPVRVMIRESDGMKIGDRREIETLRERAREAAVLPADGLVLGFIRDRKIDKCAALRVLQEAPKARATFHRAFDEVADPLRAIDDLKEIGQIDLILTNGGEGNWAVRKRRLLEWQHAALPEIAILVAAGLCPAIIDELNQQDPPFQFHVGRAARLGHQVSNPVDRRQVAAVKDIIR